MYKRKDSKTCNKEKIIYKKLIINDLEYKPAKKKDNQKLKFNLMPKIMKNNI
jgi:hypothetical protein